MQGHERAAAVHAAISVVSGLGLAVDDAVTLQDANRLTVRLRPCDVVARIAPAASRQHAAFEMDVARQLAEAGSPVGTLDPRVTPRVYLRDGFAITLWTWYEPVAPDDIAPAAYADALAGLHAGMRQIDFPTPHFTDRVTTAQRLVGSEALTPALGDEDRAFLVATLGDLRQVVSQSRAAEQLLHGEPHPGNLLRTRAGLLFIDLETCCRGPVEFDIASAPMAVGQQYRDIDQGLLAACRMLTTALVAAWRWDREDQFPDGRRMGIDLLARLRAARG